MVAESLFMNGGSKVLEYPTNEDLGFVWVEPASGGGQLQRWMLRALSNSYVLVPWEGAPTSLTEWIEKVPSLWVESEAHYYVVAQSTVVEPGVGGLLQTPSPTYPRRGRPKDIVAAPKQRPGTRVPAPAPAPKQRPGTRVAAPARAQRAGQGLLGPSTLKPNTPPVGQIVVPFAEIYQWVDNEEPEIVGICGGEIEPMMDELENELEYFDGQEVFLLLDGYVRAGGQSSTSIEARVHETLKTFADVRGHIETSWASGCRCEVTGCNYYQGTARPPPTFL